jgi:hypothetical protein
VPAGPPPRWTGSATFTEDVQYTNGSAKNRFELEVTWVKAENPSPAPPAGTTRYVASGRVHVVMQSYIDIGRCTVDQDGFFPIEVTAGRRNPEDQSLDLGPDGQYRGRLYGEWTLPYLQVCGDQGFSRSGQLRMSLEIAGALDAGRMRGDMPHKVLTIPSSLTSTSTGSWSFAAN